MLTVTEQAAHMIEKLAAQAALPEGAGLRIAQREDSPSLAMTLATTPEHDDAVLVHRDITIFLDPVAAARLRDETLNARSNEAGSAFFFGL